MAQKRKILVRSTNWIGDAIMLTPAITALREHFPHAHIAVSARPWVLPVFSENPHIDQLIPAERAGGISDISEILKFSRKIKREGFDTGIVFPNSFSAAFTAWLSKIPQRIGYATDMRRLFLSKSFPVPDWKNERHEVFYYRNLVEQFSGNTCNEAPRLVLHVSRAADRWMKELCNDRGIRRHDIVIGFNPGAAFGPAKCWPAEHFATLGKMLMSAPELGAWKVWIVVLGTEKEEKTGESICSGIGKNALNLCGRTDLSQVMAAIERLDLLVTNDSGLMHVGAALDRPLVALFGSTNPVTTGPWSNKSRIVQNRVACAPCLRRTCPSNFECMQGITPEQVFEACTEQLEEYAL